MENKRHFFAQDTLGTWYLLPVELREEWYWLMKQYDPYDHKQWPKFEKFEISGVEDYSFFRPQEIGN
jgi:hypothetical protein